MCVFSFHVLHWIFGYLRLSLNSLIYHLSFIRHHFGLQKLCCFALVWFLVSSPFDLLATFSALYLPFPQPFGLDSPFKPASMDINSNQDASGSSSPTQAPVDDFPLTEAQMQASSLFALPLGPDGSNVVVDLAPGSTAHLDPATLDPTLLPGVPRVDNQYNEDYTDNANQVHASNHGNFYVAAPHEEWAFRNYGTARY